jgi:PEP-CTERM motif
MKKHDSMVMLAVVAAVVVAVPPGVSAQPVRNVATWNTFRNTSGTDANDFRFTASNPMIDMTVYDTSGARPARISLNPPAGTFPAASVDLNLFVPVGSPGSVEVKVVAPQGTRYDPDNTYFTFNGAALRTQVASLVPNLMNLGGNNYEVVLTNVNSAPVTISSLVYGSNDPGNPYQDNYVPGGNLVSITPPSSPLAAGGTLTYDFTANPLLAVSFTDVIALSSDPSNQFTDIVAVRSVPEPSTVILLATGLLGLLGYGWRRRCGPR